MTGLGVERQKHDMVEKFILLLYFLYCSGNFCLLSMEVWLGAHLMGIFALLFQSSSFFIGH